DPQIARFTSADSVIDGARSTQGWNRFSYVAGNPIRYKDPTGHTVDSALELIKENRENILEAARVNKVSPLLLGRVVFQENFNDQNLIKYKENPANSGKFDTNPENKPFWNKISNAFKFGGPEIKNFVKDISNANLTGSSFSEVKHNNYSIGIVQMKPDTAAEILGVDRIAHNKTLINDLKNPKFALNLAARQLRIFADQKKGAKGTELLSAYNGGKLMQDKENTTRVGRQSLNFQSEIAKALDIKK
ncbi:RHS repeat-associated core domain-containing protein, partial [Leptospira wolffii]